MEEMASQPWYSVGPNDIFPEEFRLFFSGNQRARKAFDERHSDLYDAGFWQALQERIRSGLRGVLLSLSAQPALSRGPRLSKTGSGTLA
jgi:isocitrate dehydrogenase kinase/phosphatase